MADPMTSDLKFSVTTIQKKIGRACSHQPRFYCLTYKLGIEVRGPLEEEDGLPREVRRDRLGGVVLAVIIPVVLDWKGVEPHVRDAPDLELPSSDGDHVAAAEPVPQGASEERRVRLQREREQKISSRWLGT